MKEDKTIDPKSYLDAPFFMAGIPLVINSDDVFSKLLGVGLLTVGTGIALIDEFKHELTHQPTRYTLPKRSYQDSEYRRNPSQYQNKSIDSIFYQSLLPSAARVFRNMALGTAVAANINYQDVVQSNLAPEIILGIIPADAVRIALRKQARKEHYQSLDHAVSQ